MDYFQELSKIGIERNYAKDILRIIKKKGGFIVHAESDFRAREYIYKPGEFRPSEESGSYIARFLKRLNFYPEIPVFSPEIPISLIEFIVHTLEHLMMFYLLYLLLTITTIHYEYYPGEAPITEDDIIEDWADEDYVSDNKKDFMYEFNPLVYMGVFVCGIISCYCLIYYSTRPDGDSLRLSNGGAYNQKVLQKSAFGYHFGPGFYGRSANRMEALYRMGGQYYGGTPTYSDHCHGTHYIHFKTQRRYVSGNKRSYYGKKRFMYYSASLVYDLKGMASIRNQGTLSQRITAGKTMTERIQARAEEYMHIHNQVIYDFGTIYVKTSDKWGRGLNGYIKNQQSKIFRQGKKKRFVS